jgi:hypothetical protein
MYGFLHMADLSHIMATLRQILSEAAGPLPHQVAMTLVSRQLGELLVPECYFKAIDQLSAQGLVGRARGQGGSIFMLPGSVPVATEPGGAAVGVWSEQNLMSCLKDYLEKQYWRMLDRPINSLWLVIDTATMRPDSGKWSHPDFAVVSVTPLQILPTPILDVYSFELKAEAACNLTSVHEALAQTRQTHYGTLVWHLQKDSRHESRLAEVEQGCEQHGIGLILIRDPLDTDTWQIRLHPSRKRTAAADIDGFLAARLNEQQKAKLRSKLNGAPR